MRVEERGGGRGRGRAGGREGAIRSPGRAGWAAGLPEFRTQTNRARISWGRIPPPNSYMSVVCTVWGRKQTALARENPTAARPPAASAGRGRQRPPRPRNDDSAETGASALPIDMPTRGDTSLERNQTVNARRIPDRIGLRYQRFWCKLKVFDCGFPIWRQQKSMKLAVFA